MLILNLEVSVYRKKKRRRSTGPFRIASYGFASRTGFADELKKDPELLLLDLEDLYR